MKQMRALVPWFAAITIASAGLVPSCASAAAATEFPGRHWTERAPAAVGLSADTLAELSTLVGGRGCVVRHGFLAYTWGEVSKSGDVASAFKPLLSTLLLIAVQEGKLASVDAPVRDFEPRLASLGKDADMTWRHLANQLSGYGLIEPPGAAYSYNDFAITLYYDTLTLKVFGTNGTEVLRSRLAGPLQFEDQFTFNAFGTNNRPGRLALSVRDFARFGLLCLRDGRWARREIVRPDLLHLAMNSPLPPATPLTSGTEAPMLPRQRSLGGTRNITRVGPGYYSFNWWLNHTNAAGQRLFVEGPRDAILASGHGGQRVLCLVPSLDLIVCWNDSRIDDHDRSPGHPDTRMNSAMRLVATCVREGK